jgi:hypothetical protein
MFTGVQEITAAFLFMFYLQYLADVDEKLETYFVRSF